MSENKLRAETESKTKNVEEVFDEMLERFESEQKRFRDLYKIDNTDKLQYDLVVDTNQHNLEEVVALILREYKNWLAS